MNYTTLFYFLKSNKVEMFIRLGASDLKTIISRNIIDHTHNNSHDHNIIYDFEIFLL